MKHNAQMEPRRRMLRIFLQRFLVKLNSLADSVAPLKSQSLVMQILGVFWIKLDGKFIVFKSLLEVGGTIKGISTVEKQRSISSVTFDRIREIADCISKMPHMKRRQPTIVQVFGIFLLLDCSAEAFSSLLVLLLLNVRQPQVVACFWIILGVCNMLLQVLNTEVQISNLPVADTAVKPGLGRLLVVVVERFVEIIDGFVELLQIVVHHAALDIVLLRFVMLVAQCIVVIVKRLFSPPKLSEAIPTVSVVHCIPIFKPNRHTEIKQSPLVL
mmetsp:Transcript_19900/g.48383  ORF Transcript_19900/g.48383 Transcript_19900/m.48383 type:complete len:271 (-) Transcript_19900:280-1092(-)